MTTNEIVYAAILDGEKQGDIYQPINSIVTHCRRKYPKLTEKDILATLTELSADGELLHVDNRYAVTQTAADERYLGSRVVSYIRDNAPYDPFDCAEAVKQAQLATDLHLSASQLAAVTGALQNRMSIITGGPGCGKTTCLKVLYAAYQSVSPKEIVLLAPTGKAARRMSEQIFKVESRTVHAALYCKRGQVRRYDDKEWCPGLIIIDEASMLSINLMADLLRSISPATRVILVGDPDQLPAVGPGQVLADLIDSGLPVYFLTDNFRQGAGGILAASIALVRDGCGVLPYDGQQLSFQDAASGEAAEALVMAMYAAYRRMGQSVQILTPIDQAGGACSALELNLQAQEMTNPLSAPCDELRYQNVTYRIGDRVMQRKNTEVVKNGDLGTVIAVSAAAGRLTVKMDTGETVGYSEDGLSQLSHAYAITIHRSQGSEYDYVIIPVIPQHTHMWSRNMVYTAMSRARKGLIIIGSKEVFQAAITTPVQARQSLLSANIGNSLHSVA